MGRYLSFSFDSPRDDLAPRIVEGLIRSEAVNVVGVGAVEIHGRQMDLLVGGCALELFAKRWSEPNHPPPGAVTFACSTPDESEYLETIVAMMRRRGANMPLLSPYERIDVDPALSFIEHPGMKEPALASISSWSREHEHPTFKIYVALHIADCNGVSVDRPWAFRLVDEATGVPGPSLAVVTLTRSPWEPSRMQVNLFSEALLWLRSGVRADRGGPSSADENLSRLARIAAVLAAHAPKVIEPTLKLDGRTFQSESNRIHEAFAAHFPGLPEDTAW